MTALRKKQNKSFLPASSKKKAKSRAPAKKKSSPRARTRITSRVRTRLSPGRANLSLIKPPENPILLPQVEHEWEAWQVFNPGALLLENSVHFLYRAIGKEGISRFGYARSKDGLTIDERFPTPVYEHPLGNRYSYTSYGLGSGGSWGGCEDPRLVRVADTDTIYMTYTAVDQGLHVGLTSIHTQDFLEKNWRWAPPRVISRPDEIHKNWVIFPERILGKYAILHALSPQIRIAFRDRLEFEEGEYIESAYCNGAPPRGGWESWVKGVGPPPLKTDHGWLLFYHGIDREDLSRYKLGVMLLDLEDPTQVLVRSPTPVLEPKETYENQGYKPGIVYASGAVIKDGTLFIYYGGSDNYVCCAYTSCEDFVEGLLNLRQPRFQRQTLKRPR
jgi:predicted GH43/DUF377 family glycosyl hydrolase